MPQSERHPLSRQIITLLTLVYSCLHSSLSLAEVEEIRKPIYPQIVAMSAMGVHDDAANCDDNRHQLRDRPARPNRVVVVVHGEMSNFVVESFIIQMLILLISLTVIRALDGIHNQHQLNVHQDLKQSVDNRARPRKF